MAKEAKEKTVRTDFLIDKTVTVKYITKEVNGITNPKHVAYGGILNGAEISIPAPTMDNGKMKNLLTNIEKEVIVPRHLEPRLEDLKNLGETCQVMPVLHVYLVLLLCLMFARTTRVAWPEPCYPDLIIWIHFANFVFQCILLTA